MIRIKRFLLLAALLPCIAHAQSAFQPATLVTAKGDTLHGALDYKEWEFSPKTIRFKQDNSAEAVKYTADQVKFFSVQVGHLEAYEGYVGPITMNNIDPGKITNGRDTSFKTDTVFLRVLQDGKKLKLFSYTDGIKTRFFIAENYTDQPRELIYRMYWNNQVSDGGYERTTYESDYKRQLYDEAVKAGVMTPDFKRSVSKADYRVEDMLQIAGTINGLSSSDIKKNNPGKHSSARTAIIVVAAAIIVAELINEFSKLSH